MDWAQEHWIFKSPQIEHENIFWIVAFAKNVMLHELAMWPPPGLHVLQFRNFKARLVELQLLFPRARSGFLNDPSFWSRILLQCIWIPTQMVNLMLELLLHLDVTSLQMDSHDEIEFCVWISIAACKLHKLKKKLVRCCCCWLNLFWNHVSFARTMQQQQQQQQVFFKAPTILPFL